MTVYFDKGRGKWRHDFWHANTRYVGLCVDPAGKPVSTKQAAKRAEARVRAQLPRAGCTQRSAGWIYFIASEDGAHVKIGWAKSVKSRMKALQAMNPRKLNLLARRRGRMSDETAIHERLKSARIHGEWFAATAEVLAYIDFEIRETAAIGALIANGVIGNRTPTFLLYSVPQEDL